MNRLINILFLFALAAQGFAADDFYTAGVVEFQPKFEGLNSSALLADHLAGYMDLIKSNEANDTDIIIFPEGTLNNELQLTYVPKVSDKVVPCDASNQTYAQFLRDLSCLARDTKKYLVINLIEKENCTNTNQCASDGLNTYNTNVVFDRKGQVISRYRKFHIYNESRNTTEVPELATFSTDFGVTFGHFICFDLLFYSPAQELVDKQGIKHLIMTSMFFSELPFLTGVQLQESWAWGNNVVLLAAGASSPERGMTGSGIYLGNQGSLVSVMAIQNGERKLYKATVPKVIPKSINKADTSDSPKPALVGRNLMLYQDPNITDFKTVPFNFSGANSSSLAGSVCHNNFCCNYTISTEKKNTTVDPNAKFYQYRVGVLNGLRTYQAGGISEIQVCGLFACLNETIESCAQVFGNQVTEQSNFMFTKIHLTANFTKAQPSVVMPSTLDLRIQPLPAQKIAFQSNERNGMYDVSISLNGTADDVLTFGIYSKLYRQSSGAETLFYSPIVMMLFLLLSHIF